MLLCFYMMVILSIFMVTVSLLTRNDSPEAAADTPEMVKVPSPSVRERNIMRILWSLVAIVMMILYYVFR